MKNHPFPPKYIVVREPGLNPFPTGYLYELVELDDEPHPNNTWRPHPDAPEYTKLVEGKYGVIRELAVKLNKANDAYIQELAEHEAKKESVEIIRKPGHPKGSD